MGCCNSTAAAADEPAEQDPAIVGLDEIDPRQGTGSIASDRATASDADIVTSPRMFDDENNARRGGHQSDFHAGLPSFESRRRRDRSRSIGANRADDYARPRTADEGSARRALRHRRRGSPRADGGGTRGNPTCPACWQQIAEDGVPSPCHCDITYHRACLDRLVQSQTECVGCGRVLRVRRATSPHPDERRAEVLRQLLLQVMQAQQAGWGSGGPDAPERSPLQEALQPTLCASPTQREAGSEGHDTDWECTICQAAAWEPQADDDDAASSGKDDEDAEAVAARRGRCVSLPCGHVFHGRCIEPWLQQNRDCPLCRQKAHPAKTQQPAVASPTASHRTRGPVEDDDVERLRRVLVAGQERTRRRREEAEAMRQMMAEERRQDRRRRRSAGLMGGGGHGASAYGRPGVGAQWMRGSTRRAELEHLDARFVANGTATAFDDDVHPMHAAGGAMGGASHHRTIMASRAPAFQLTTISDSDSEADQDEPVAAPPVAVEPPSAAGGNGSVE